ncbi:MAG: four helix bundle suffix domain-containing protein [Lentisphaeria bacterium]|jgi:restriction system protein
MHHQGFIPPHGGYEALHSYKKSLIIFVATYYLAEKWVRMGSRTRDQMEQSARSGKQNIVEGSLASATSKKTELHLTNVARASIGELLEDYKDFLRLRRLPIWHKDDPRMLAIRALGTEQATYENYQSYIESDDPELVGNVMVCLCAQAGYLLDQQLRELERAFLHEGGIRERMTRARLEARGEPQPAAMLPTCPLCGKPMRQRTARQGANAGKPFWGCTSYPDCRGTRKFAEGGQGM